MKEKTKKPGRPTPQKSPKLGGRKPTDASGRQKRRSVMLTDLEVSEIVERYGTLSGGVRAMFREIFRAESPRK